MLGKALIRTRDKLVVLALPTSQHRWLFEMTGASPGSTRVSTLEPSEGDRPSNKIGNPLAASVLPRLDRASQAAPSPNDSPAQVIKADDVPFSIPITVSSFSTQLAKDIYKLRTATERARLRDIGRNHAGSKQQWRKRTRKSSSTSHFQRNMLRMLRSTGRKS